MNRWDNSKDMSQQALDNHYSSLCWSCQQNVLIDLFFIKKKPKTLFANIILKLYFSYVVLES